MYPLASHAHPPTLDDIDGVEEAKIDEGNVVQLSPAMDAPPKPRRTDDATSVVVSNQLADIAQSPLLDPSHECASSAASQIDALHAALQESIRANTAVREAMQEANQTLDVKLEAFMTSVSERIMQKASQTLEAKLETFMTSVSNRLGVIEQVIVERHDHGIPWRATKVSDKSPKLFFCCLTYDASNRSGDARGTYRGGLLYPGHKRGSCKVLSCEEGGAVARSSCEVGSREM